MPEGVPGVEQAPCLSEDNFSFNNNYMIQELLPINIYNKPHQCRNTDYWVDDSNEDE